VIGARKKLIIGQLWFVYFSGVCQL